MAFMLEDKIGVIKLPLTGNPHLASALIVHPQGVRFIFSTTTYIDAIIFITVEDDGEARVRAG